MDIHFAEWGGAERPFRLNFGLVLDLERACGRGIGAITLDLFAGRWGIKDTFETIRLGLEGGGMRPEEARALCKDHFDHKPYFQAAELALAIITAAMSGVEKPGEDEGGDPEEPISFGSVAQICTVFHMSPQDVREMRYADFVNVVKGYRAAGKKVAEPMSEEEFDAMLARHEPSALKG